MSILVVDDDPLVRATVARTLSRSEYQVNTAADGVQALEMLRREAYQAVLTDWMMPEMDGIELMRRIRAEFRPPPVIIVITALSSGEARDHALQVGADAYLAKPFAPRDLLGVLENCLKRRNQKTPQATPDLLSTEPTAGQTPGAAASPPYVAVALAASTGGPRAITQILNQMPAQPKGAFFVVLHAPTWALCSFADRLDADVKPKVHLARHGMQPVEGNVYLAPGGTHMVVDPDSHELRLTDDPPENYVRPAADPLFRSVAQAFGKYCVAVVLTGLGCDGSLGATAVTAAGGVVLAQDPATADAPFMPRAVIDLGIATATVSLSRLGGIIAAYTQKLTLELR